MPTLRLILPLATLAAALVATGCVTSGETARWSCNAANLVNARYDGSSHAYIHLQGFSSGGMYPVKLKGAGTEATGSTANGTPFTCVKNR